MIKLNVNSGGGLINHIAVKDDKVYKSEDNIIKLIEELKMQE